MHNSEDVPQKLSIGSPTKQILTKETNISQPKGTSCTTAIIIMPFVSCCWLSQPQATNRIIRQDMLYSGKFVTI
ncbi:hypothetical protein PAHAL_9G619400 [Panicum hallii]|jgi:hypothetical protein|uniref:Uncharacterized protein n=1 Tax=Panicum hallii TaxID=206008 RepID=A0A2S3IUL8_9POAL|nr:hypothetical protein PAHAL_9G619400 [Panicum hallii]